MPNTEMDGGTHNGRTIRCPMGKCLGRDDVQTCHKYPWLTEFRERLVSPIIGESSGVTRCRVVRRSTGQAERKKPVAKKVGTKKKTLAGKRTNPVLRKGHPQDVAHAATVEEAESDATTELYSFTSLRKAANPKPPLTETITMGRDREQPFYNEDRQCSDSGGSRRIVDWSRRRPATGEVACGRRSPHKHINFYVETLYLSLFKD